MSRKMYFATLAIGAVIGSVATWQILKRKYEKQKQEEIESVKNAFNNLDKAKCRHYPDADEDRLGDTMDKKYMSIASKYGDTEENASPSSEPNPFEIISADEFGEKEGYDRIYLTYFADDILADDAGNVIVPNETVSEYALTTFGEYDDDVVFVRNHDLKTDFEILLDQEKYTEVYGNLD